MNATDELLNDQLNEQLEAPLADSVMLLPPSIEETRKAIRWLKNNKAPGTDGIAAELVKNGGARLENEIHQIVTEVWDSESMSKRKTEGIRTHRMRALQQNKHCRSMALLRLLHG